MMNEIKKQELFEKKLREKLREGYPIKYAEAFAESYAEEYLKTRDLQLKKLVASGCPEKYILSVGYSEAEINIARKEKYC